MGRGTEVPKHLRTGLYKALSAEIESSQQKVTGHEISKECRLSPLSNNDDPLTRFDTVQSASAERNIKLKVLQLLAFHASLEVPVGARQAPEHAVHVSQVKKRQSPAWKGVQPAGVAIILSRKERHTACNVKVERVHLNRVPLILPCAYAWRVNDFCVTRT